jgi:HAE1 family hydrophobic/amphiphilic exporter-1
MLLSDLSIKRPVFATVMMLTLVTLGLFSYRRLSVDMYPDVEIPVVSIVTVYEGASPETVEREVTKRIEEAVNPISGVKHVMSISRESVSTVVVEFRLEVKVDDAAQDVRAKISGIRSDLPKAMDEPIIQKLDFANMPIVSLAVRSNVMPPRELSTLVEKKVKRRIESVSGVGKVNLVGLLKREVAVEINPGKLEALGLGVDQIIGGIQSENVNTPLGRLKRGDSEYPLRVSGKPDMVEQFKTMVIGQKDNRPITLSEVADVKDSIEEQRTTALVNGVPAVGLDILKQSGANTVDVVDSVKKIVDKLQPEMPDGTTIEIVRDGSIMIRDSVHDVQKTMIEGGILTILIVFLFLNSWRSTVITGLTLPISVIASFIAMNFMGMTLNVMTLMALSLAIGMLIDDAIVVRENIVRHMEMGKDHFQAAKDGTSEIGLAVLATTFSIVAVFVPVAFMKGIVGRFFFQFGITVTFAVLVSLFVSFTLDPMLSSRWYDPDIERKGKRHFVARLLDSFNDWFDRTADRYKGAIAWALDHRISVVVMATLVFIAGMAIFVTLPSAFMQTFDRAEFQIDLKTAPDASIDETKKRVDAILVMLKSFPEILHTYSTIGSGDSGTVRDGHVYVKLKEKTQRERSQNEIQDEVRRRLQDIPGIVPAIVEVGRLHGVKKIEFSIRGENIDTLKHYGAQIKKELYKIKGIIDLEVSMEDDTPEYRLIVNRERAMDAGVTTGAIVRTVGALVGGEASTTYEDEDGDAVDVRVRLPEDLRQDPAQVERLRLSVRNQTGSASLIQLGDLVSYEIGATPSEINRRDLIREIKISSNLEKSLDMGTAMKEIKRIAAGLEMAHGYQLVFSGEAEDMVESFIYMAEALLMAIIFVYLILAAQFESFIEPFSIMFSLPLSLVGMAAMLKITGDAVNIMSLIGLIMLMGLVTKNAILLVDYTKILRSEGMDRRNAVITAGRTRLRPIMMTTLAMIFGMLPLALGLGAGAEMRAPMGRAVIGGLITSTLLTLLVVPVVYTILDDLGSWLQRKWVGNNHNSVHPIILVLIMTAFLMMPVSARAVETRELTLADALKLAAEQNKDIKMAEAYRNLVEGRYVEERSAALPKLSLGASIGTSTDETQTAISPMIPTTQKYYGGEITLSQPLFTWGQIGAAIRAAKIGLKTADDEMNAYRQAVVRDVSAAFYDTLLAKELYEIAVTNLYQKQRHFDEAKRKLAAGTATDYDVLSAEVSVANARPDVIKKENMVRISRERLGILVCLEGRSFDVKGSLEATPTPVPDPEESFKTAITKRAELSELNNKIGMQKEAITVYNSMDKPRIDLYASYGWRHLDVETNTADGEVSKAAVLMSFPFFDGMKTRGKVAQSRSELSTLTLQAEKLKDSIRLQTEESSSALKEAAEILKALEGVVTRAERLVAMAEKGFIHGVKTNLDVQDAQLALKEARGNLAKAKRDYLVAQVTLSWVMGTLVVDN